MPDIDASLLALTESNRDGSKDVWVAGEGKNWT